MGLIRESMKIKKIFSGLAFIQPDGNTLVSCRFFHIHGGKGNPVYRPKYTRFVVSNYSSYVSDNNEYYNDEWRRETITRIFAYLRRLVDAVIADADGFNEYVAGNLPYQQRTGKIARKDFNRIEPRFRIESKDRKLP